MERQTSCAEDFTMAVKTRAELRQALGEVKENPVRLPIEKAREVIDALNQDLCSEYVLYHQYKKHHWIVQGAEYYELHLLLDKHADGVREIADQMAELITWLQGVPVASMSKMEQTSYVKPEPEGLYDLRWMIQNDLAMNQQIIECFRQRVEMAGRLGDYATQYCYMEWLVKHEKWAHDLDASLAMESLTRAIPHGNHPAGR